MSFCILANQTQIIELATPLLQWYDRNKREMPWRDVHNAYYTWVSEMMLQQTRVEAVRSYFSRFIEALPNIQALAACEESRLLKLWEGLGYYNRVRNLQKAARVVVEQYDGRLPADYDQLLQLPGIGPYTAGAIASIAYGLPVPCVDGNVLRVFSRLLACDEDIAKPAAKQEVAALVQTMLPPGRPGDFNQALMELGAVVCLPSGTPLCASCPVASFCVAHREGTELAFPVKTAKAARRVEQRTVFLLVSKRSVLLTKRPDSGLLAGMWEFPSTEGVVCAAELPGLLSGQGICAKHVYTLKPAKHIFTHLEWHMQGYLVEVEQPFPVEHGHWATAVELQQNCAIPSAFSAYRADVERWLEA